MTIEIVVFAVLAIAAFAIVIIPSLRGSNAPPSDAMSNRTVEEEVTRYRDALRSDTLCRHCGQANPPSSRYCYECGKLLPTADREEFEGTGEAA